jgi:aryl-alcohol dehydrogenase-like predicted oxidoreductase
MIERAAFGRTGHESTRVLFGAAALGNMRQDRADATLALAREHGVNHIDTAAAYGDSEVRLKPFLAEHRHEVFLATKTGDRTGDGARASLERSLERMGVDHVDSIQLHNLVEEDEWAVAHGPGGAVEALAKARDEGLTRFIGVTGHGKRIAGMHRRSLERFPFDTVLFPYNFALLRDEAYRRDVDELRAICAERGVATQVIKAVAKRRWREDDPRPHYSWYEPLPAGPALARAVRWVLSEPSLFLLTSSDATLLGATLEAAEAGGAVPTDAELAADAEAEGTEPLFDWRELERI